MDNIFIPLFVIIIFILFFGMTTVILISEINTKLRELENICKHKWIKSEEPLTATDIKIDKFERGKCPVCGNTVWHSDKRCKNCGQKIKWENEDESKNDS